jgi:hypothetical protein
MMTETKFLETLIKVVETDLDLLTSQIGKNTEELEESVKNVREGVDTLKNFLRERDVDNSLKDENYKRKLEQTYDELDAEENAYIPIRRLIQLFVKLDKEYNHQPWDLLRILRCIDVICPMYVDDEEEE